MLNKSQVDALWEMISIGFGRAASSLSYMIGQRIVLEAPELNIVPLDQVDQALDYLSENEMLTVHQVFSGKISGDTMLLFDKQSAARLVKLLYEPERSRQPGSPSGEPGEETSENDLNSRMVDAISEIGNVVLSAFTGSFGNLLHIHISFTVPKLYRESVVALLQSLRTDKAKLNYAVVVKLYFRLVDQNVGSHMLIVMGLDSLDRLFESMIQEGYLRGEE
jgi:chemotaxis protein CheC